MSVTVIAARLLRGVDPNLGEVRLVDLDLGLRAQVIDEVLLRLQPLFAEELVADLRLRVVEALRDRLAAAGLLEDVERAVAGIEHSGDIAGVDETERTLDHRRGRVLRRQLEVAQ